jgi:hypothetical protein
MCYNKTDVYLDVVLQTELYPDSLIGIHQSSALIFAFNRYLLSQERTKATVTSNDYEAFVGIPSRSNPQTSKMCPSSKILLYYVLSSAKPRFARRKANQVCQ